VVPATSGKLFDEGRVGRTVPRPEVTMENGGSIDNSGLMHQLKPIEGRRISAELPTTAYGREIRPEAFGDEAAAVSEDPKLRQHVESTGCHAKEPINNSAATGSVESAAR